MKKYLPILPGAWLLALISVAMVAPAFAQTKLGDQLSTTATEIERRVGGRLGISVTDLASGDTWAYQGDERFPLGSTFKAFACAHALYLADHHALALDTPRPFSASALDAYSPVTRERVGAPGMSVRELCAAATAMSDNTAANLILKATGGPQALTRFMRQVGDPKTRLDRYEPQLNEVPPGETRDTTTPNAAAASLRTLMLGSILSEAARRQLTAWLLDSKVSDGLFRASLPTGWRIADRTGAAAYGSRGIIAVIWPTGEGVSKGPVIATAYLTGTSLSLQARDEVMAQVGAALVRDLKP